MPLKQNVVRLWSLISNAILKFLSKFTGTCDNLPNLNHVHHQCLTQRQSVFFCAAYYTHTGWVAGDDLF